MDALSRFLAEAELRRFVDGEWDWCLFPAAWVQRITGIDAAAPWRGRYRTRLGWARILKREGGIAGVMAAGAVRARLTETIEPLRGDVGVIDQGRGDIGAICLGVRWATVGQHGLTVSKASPSRAWRVLNGSWRSHREGGGIYSV